MQPVDTTTEIKNAVRVVPMYPSVKTLAAAEVSTLTYVSKRYKKL